MLTWILLIIVLAALVVLGTWSWGRFFGRGEVLDPVEDSGAVIEDNRRLVDAGRADDVRFELVPRGYRPEQVDEVIAHLAGRLEKANEELTKMRGEGSGQSGNAENSGTPPVNID